MKTLTDEALIERYRQIAGTPEALPYVEELLGRHYGKVALWCQRISGDPNQAADLAQEVMTKAWAHLGHFEGKSKFTTWLYTIARNHCFNRVKSPSWRSEEGADTEFLESLADSGPGPDRAAEANQRLALARQMMANELTEVERQVMTLHFAEDVPLDTISRLLRLENASGAKAFIVSAKRKLKSSMARLAGGRNGGRDGT